MRIISIVNQKGGCGKTITAVNLSDCLALRHKKVLLIDLDPQSNATIAMGIDEQDISKCMYDVFCNETPIKDVIKEKYPNFFIAPSRLNLSAVEQFLAGQAGRETVLLNALNQIQNEFDFIIIDCPPSMGLLTFNALRVSHELIIPIETSTFSIHGLGRLLGAIDLMKEKCGQSIAFKALTTIFDKRTKFSWEMLDEIKRHFADKLYTTIIHNNVRLKEAVRAGKPISRFDTGSLGFFDYDALAKEIISNTGEMPDYKPSTQSSKKNQRGIMFACEAPEAQSVQLVGDFNNWAPNHIILENKKKNGVWEKKLVLPKGRYQYRYIIDGNWVNDPANEHTAYSPYGGLNSVIEV